MKNDNLLLVVFNSQDFSDKANEQETKDLQRILAPVFSPEYFSAAHELVDRFRITNRKKKVLKEAGYISLRPFRFLVNKN